MLGLGSSVGWNWKVRNVLAWAFLGVTKWLVFQSSAFREVGRLTVQYLMLNEESSGKRNKRVSLPGSR